MNWHNGPGGTVDPVYKVRWAGSSVGGPDGDLRWGLDSGDYENTGNHVSMDTYLRATQAYADYCRTNGIKTKVFFTTGPVDSYNDGENGYQRHLKNEHIRNYVRASSEAILFDYADILCWSDSAELKSSSWTDSSGTLRNFPLVHPDNMLDLNGGYAEDGDHIGQRGALRLGKALWYMAARLAGWDPDNASPHPVLTISTVTPGIVQIGFTALSNTAYAIECSPDPSAGSWESLTNIPTAPDDRQIQLQYPVDDSVPRRFYRAAPSP